MSASLIEVQREEFSILDSWLRAKEFVVVGKSVRRIDSLEKVLGKARYVEDYLVEGMLYARIVKSEVAHGVIKSVKPGRAAEHPDFIDLVTAGDVPGQNQVGYYLSDQPAIAEGKVRFHGEPVAMVVAKSPESADLLREIVEIEINPLPAVFDPLEAMKDQVIIHEEVGSNVVIKTRIGKGDAAGALEKSDYVVEGEYRMGYQDHAYIEPEGALAIPRDGEYTIIAPAQYPHLAQLISARVLGIPQSRVRIVQPMIGGAFGGKDDMGPILAAQAAIAAYKTGRPILLTYSREDSFTSHCKRDPAVIYYKSGANRDGKLTAVQVRIIFDAGAYANRGPFTLWRATAHASGPYEVPNVDSRGFLVYTNKVYQGSFRGFGNPQVQFAAERQMDELAEKIGIDPLEFRLMNILKPGSRTCTNQLLDHSVGIGEALRKVADASGWREKRKRYGRIEDGKARGIGVACAWHGISTSRGVPDWCNAYINVSKDGSVSVYTGIVEFGQGSHTGITQIVSEALGIPVEKINLIGGTSDAPDTGATHGSRGLSFGGTAALIAATKIRKSIQRVAARTFGCGPDDVELRDGWVYCGSSPEKRMRWEDAVKACYLQGEEMSATGYFFMPKEGFDEKKGQGQAYVVFSYMAIIAEVEVDVETGLTRVLRVWPALCAGRIVNPELAKGQVDGAILQGIGYMLLEEIKVKDGKILNPGFTDYLVPTIMDLPEIMDPIYVEDYFKYGPMGAKGLAEMALIPMAPAIGNAIKHAVGVGPREVPYPAEKLYMELRKVRGR